MSRTITITVDDEGVLLQGQASVLDLERCIGTLKKVMDMQIANITEEEFYDSLPEPIRTIMLKGMKEDAEREKEDRRNKEVTSRNTANPTLDFGEDFTKGFNKNKNGICNWFNKKRFY
jgi:hypothetical protein